MTRPDGALWTARINDYKRFHDLEVASGSIDPVYRVLARIARSVTPREMALLSFLHVAFYDLGSALRAWGQLNRQADLGRIDSLLTLRCGTERRGMRTHRELAKHLTALFTLDHEHGGLHRWANQFPTYRELFPALLAIYGNGRWAAYKTSELLAWAMPVAEGQGTAWIPSDMGHANSSGPRQGLALVSARPLPTTNRKTDLLILDAIANDLVDYLTSTGSVADHATAETTLCDFHALVEGRYYPGHDIHQLGEQLARARTEATDAGDGWGRREVNLATMMARAAFGDAYAEAVDRPRKGNYRFSGRLA